MYGTAEAVVGDLLAAAPPAVPPFRATKVWTRGAAAGLAQMQQSLCLLRTERIDLMQIHNLLDWRVHLPNLRAWKRDGRLRYIGVTHYSDSAHADLAAAMQAEPLDFVQFNCSLEDRAAERTLLPLADERGIAVVINLPLGGGGLLRRLGQRPLPGWADEIGVTSWSQALLKYILGHPAVTCVIPGTGNPLHMADNAKAGLGEFPDAPMRRRMIESFREGK